MSSEFIDWQQTAAQVIAWRRQLHQHPELSHQEHWTTRFLYQQLSALPGLEILRPAKTGLVARLRGGKPGKVIAFRADIDALPVTEANSSSYISQQSGVMHACGHDAHSAMLLGAASILSTMREQLAGEVVFIFQRGEEMSPGGAKELVDSGILHDVSQFFALHLQPELATGIIQLKQGIATANRDTFHIMVHGKGGHSSMPHQCIDTTIAAAELVIALQSIISREIDPRETAVLSVCSLVSGDGTTARLPDNAFICGTTRTYLPQIRTWLKEAIKRVSQSTAEAHRCRADVSFDPWDYSAIVNDKELCLLAAEVIRTTLGTEYLNLTDKPTLVGEDFSEYQAIAPVCFAWLGVAHSNNNSLPLHSARFNP
ncbi:MAG: M20 metallopeptidase family protein, partial [Enterobacteriaceae bacterium]